MSQPIPLTRLKARKQARIVEIKRDPEGHWRKLMALGITPDTVVYLAQKFPSYILQIGHTMTALDKQMAELILVEPVRGTNG
jgi:Fe2+ transport system protein FeoA